MTSEGVVHRRNVLSVFFQIAKKKKVLAVIKTLLIARGTVNI